MLVNKFWGTERWLVNDKKAGYCVKEMTLVPGVMCSLHYHPEKDETFYIVKGGLALEIGLSDEAVRLEEGDHFRVAARTVHRFRTLRDEVCTFIECSTYHDDDDVVRIEPSRFVDGLPKE